MFLPSNSTDPEVGSRRPSTIRATVDFPEPDSPTIAEVVPRSRSKLTESTAVKPLLRTGALGRKIGFTAVDSVGFDLERGTTSATVGEAGSGKAAVARRVVGLDDATTGTGEV